MTSSIQRNDFASSLVGLRVVRICFALLLVLAVPRCFAHIGSPAICFEGNAGPTPIRAVIRPPEVVPGLAEINIRILKGNARKITVVPVFWKTGKSGAPPPDVAKPVRGETNLFGAQLWFMESGAYSVEIGVESDAGSGTVTVPVNSVAMTRREMPRWFGIMLAALGSLLFLSAARLVGLAFGESVLEPGKQPSRRLVWRSRFATAGGAALFAGLLYLGKKWWDLDDLNFRTNRLYRPVPVLANVRMEGKLPVLQLNLTNAHGRQWLPLLPDHGKLMHLFLIHQPDLNAFAHLHPIQRERKLFETIIPPLPPGEYQLHGEVTHENAFAQTLTTTVTVPELPDSYFPKIATSSAADVVCSTTARVQFDPSLPLSPDPDDSWHVGGTQKGREPSSESGQSLNQEYRLESGYRMILQRDEPLRERRATALRFKLLSPKGDPVRLEYYMGMMGHAAVRRSDGTTFAHLHPTGNYSMASLQFFSERETGRAASPQGNSASVNSAGAHSALNSDDTGAAGEASFPYEFPRGGSYRLWVQLKAQGRVFTGVFDTDVQSAK
jgi:hypothetical protein